MNMLVGWQSRTTPQCDQHAMTDEDALDVQRRPDRAAATPQRLLEGPLLGTITRLAAPNAIGAIAQISASVIQMHFVGMLGVDVLAGVTLVFPCLSLMQLVATGGIGVGVASAVARGLGAERRADAEALVLNAIVLAVAFGILFATMEVLFGPTLYRLLGGTGAAFAASLAYANWVFGSAVFVWIVNLLVSALVGSGHTIVSQVVSLFWLVVMVSLSPALMFGWGPMPRLGIAGAGLAFACYYVVATTLLIGYLRSGRAPLKLQFDVRLIQLRLMRQIMQVGALSALGVAIPVLSLTLVTSAVARFGVNVVAGYGLATRTDFLLLPLYIGLCAGVLPMVGANVGAGQIGRARRIAWSGALIASCIGGIAALFLALVPSAWLRLFSNDPVVVASGSLYFRIAAIHFPFTALAIVLGAAANGAGRPSWPFAAAIARAVVSGGGSWLVVTGTGGQLETLFAVLAIAGVFQCGVMIAGQILGRTIPDCS